MTHSVEIEAEALSEAAGMGVRAQRRAADRGTRPRLAAGDPGREPSTIHSLTVQQLHRWTDGVTTSPAEVLRRARVKQLLGR